MQIFLINRFFFLDHKPEFAILFQRRTKGVGMPNKKVQIGEGRRLTAAWLTSWRRGSSRLGRYHFSRTSA
jgi:hypothetical protein